jgi:predicted DNA-binding transcriptional regulator AlpA
MDMTTTPLSTNASMSMESKNITDRSCHARRRIDLKAELPRTIRRHELRMVVPLADSTIFEMEKRGEFPRRFNLSPRCVVWLLEEVETWLAERRRTYLSGKAKIAFVPDPKQRRARRAKTVTD